MIWCSYLSLYKGVEHVQCDGCDNLIFRKFGEAFPVKCPECGYTGEKDMSWHGESIIVSYQKVCCKKCGGSSETLWSYTPPIVCPHCGFDGDDTYNLSAVEDSILTELRSSGVREVIVRLLANGLLRVGKDGIHYITNKGFVAIRKRERGDKI